MNPRALLLDLDDTILDDSSLIHESWREACAARGREARLARAWDVAAPQRLGLAGIWIDTHGRGLPEHSSVRPDHIIRSLAELRGLLR